MSGRNRSNVHRQRLAYEAARIMADQGVRDFSRARQKAAVRAGIDNRRLWPSNGEIQEALLQYRRLFQDEKQEQETRHMRAKALEAMRSFADFRPRLVGPVLSGSADNLQGVRLHLFTDNPEDVVLALLDQGIPGKESEEVLRYGGGIRHAHPAFSFFAGETLFELVVLPIGAQRNPPFDPVTERPERGAGTEQVARLLADES